MTTPTMTPASWYSDPAGRHEHRYWDGTRWTEHVADAGVTGKDAPTISPLSPAAFTPPPPAASSGTPAAVAAPVGAGYRAVAVARWRAAVLTPVGVALVLALFFEVLASMAAAGTTSTADDGTLWFSSWLYQADVSTTAGGAFAMYYGYPPLALWVALVTAVALLVRVPRQSLWALKKAGARARWWWSVPEEQRRLASGLSALGCSKYSVFSAHQRGLLVGGGVASLGVALVSAYAIIERTGAMLANGGSGTVVSDLSVGLGPRACLAAGILGVVGVVAAWPWTPQRTILIHANGSVEAMPDAMSPPDLAPAEVAISPPPAPIANAPRAKRPALTSPALWWVLLVDVAVGLILLGLLAVVVVVALLG